MISKFPGTTPIAKVTEGSDIVPAPSVATIKENTPGNIPPGFKFS